MSKTFTTVVLVLALAAVCTHAGSVNGASLYGVATNSFNRYGAKPRLQTRRAVMNQGRVDEFWRWFSSVANSLAANVEDHALLGELDNRMLGLNGKLSWEIGPGRSKPWQFVISPNLDRDLREIARDVVARAPDLRDWEFHPARLPKDWDYKFILQRGDGNESVELDASAWTFVLLNYPDGAHEILLNGRGIPRMTDDERWQAAAITLESVLGEAIMLDQVDEFELVYELEPQFVANAKPIQQLYEAVAGR